MNRGLLAQHVASALIHLADPIALRDHPLGAFLLPGVSPDRRGQELARLLQESIDQLRPDGSLSPHTPAARRYQYLHLRYREGIRAAHVAHQLGLSERQARRIQQEAIEALASLLWTRRRSTRINADPSLHRPASELDAEIARLGATTTDSGAHLGETLRGALTTIQPLVAQRTLQVEIDVPQSLPLVAIDRAVLRQVFLNLLIAAIERPIRSISIQARHSGVQIEVTLVIRPRSTPSPPLAEGNLWTEALRVARRLIELQGGSLTVVDSSTTPLAFVFVLPVIQPSTILLVDDNPDTLRLLQRYLAGGLYRTIEAVSGRQAMDLALQARPRAIVLDVMMPSQDGWETLQALHHHPATADIPVVVCSVLRQRELALALGASDFLEKPVSRDALLTALRRLIPRAPPPQP